MERWATPTPPERVILKTWLTGPKPVLRVAKA